MNVHRNVDTAISPAGMQAIARSATTARAVMPARTAPVDSKASKAVRAAAISVVAGDPEAMPAVGAAVGVAGNQGIESLQPRICIAVR